MHIVFNSEPTDIGTISKIQPLLDYLGIKGSSFALALDGEHVFKTDYDNIELQDGARIDILLPMVGG